MSELTLSVPAEHVGTLRSAVVSEVGFWSEAVRHDLAEISDARGREDEDRAAWREGDLGDHQRCLEESGALIGQIPAPGSGVDAEIRARSRVLASLAEEGARACLKELAAELEYSPLGVERVRTKAAELTWWLSEHESFETKRVAEVEAARAEEI